MKRLSSLLVGLLVLLPVVLACNLEVGREYEADNEHADALSVAQIISKQMKREPTSESPMRRGAHAKAHGCVAAKFVVPDQIDPRARFGVFQPGAVYPAWIRFSSASASLTSDVKKGARGAAVKLMGVPGPKLLDDASSEEKSTQDFVLLSYPQFIVRDPRDYVPFMSLVSASFGSLGDLVKFAVNFLKFSWSTLMQRMNNLRVLWNTVNSGAKITNPLDAQYWSTTPYMLGPAEQYPTNAVKYMMKPCKELPATAATSSEDFLRENMRKVLRDTDACFDFYVQFQVDACKQPVEDPTVLWDESEAPYFKVGTLVVPRQEFDTPEQNQFCEHLTITPWHALLEHRPFGGINRSRRDIYLTSSTQRHAVNAVTKREPTAADEIYQRHFQ